MKINNIYLENFASYETLDFRFNDKGLVLVHGATGSGKSTLMDAIPWILFGVTAKNGKADEVVSWNGGETFGTINLDFNSNGHDNNIQITRTRKPNDLYYRLSLNTDPNPCRGKDLQDTQKQINALLGMDADLYLAGAYFHEFSQTAQFFITTPKNRRIITEQLVDLSLPIKLQEKIKLQQKDINTELLTLDNSLFTLNTKVDMLSKMVKETKNNNDLWAHEQGNKITQLQAKADNFELTKNHKSKALEQELSALKYEDPLVYVAEIGKVKAAIPPELTACLTCGVPKPNPDRELVLKYIQELEISQLNNVHKLRQANSLKNQINEIKDSTNIYKEQIIDIHSQTNPHTQQFLKLERDLDKQLLALAGTTETRNQIKDQELNLELLSDVVSSFRSELVRNTIEDLESLTNQLLTRHFDGEIKVGFQITDSDKLDVTIEKDSNQCSYTQLSKGQRQMLKLCFGIAIMNTISQHHALSFNQLFFDEALDGLDDINKLKAVKLLELLTEDHDSVYIVEHSEGIKAAVNEKYFVELINGKSQISKA